MKRDKNKYRRQPIRIFTIALLLLIYGGLGIYFRLFLHTLIVYTHFAYIPIVLAGIWWGQRSIFVALLLAIMTFAFRFFGSGEGALWSDAARTFFFLTVASCTGLLSERAMRAQKAVHASEEKYKGLIDSSLSGIFVHRENTILFVNRRFCEIAGFQSEELVGRSVEKLIYEEDRKKCGEVISGSEGGATALEKSCECRVISKDGRKIWVDLGSSPTSFEGRPAVLVNVYNITDRKEAEEKKQELLELSRRQEEQLVHAHRLAELGEMAASIAHEINQPLTAVKNFAKNTCYMLETGAGTSSDVKQNLHRITDQVDRAARIINQIRNLTRKSDRQFTLLNVNNIIRESIEFMTPQFKLHGIKVALELANEMPSVLGDKVRLEQVFLNILANASQAMEDSAERRLGIKSYFDIGNSRPVVIEITDTGKGFTSEEGKKIFTPFYTTKKPGDGTGLGLSISLTIVREHLGDIEAIGAPGVGSIFKVMFPASNSHIIGEV
jgi:histidine kinase